MEKEKTIDVCLRCEQPVVFTFLFRGAEIYCPSCGNKTGYLGGKRKVAMTPQLEKLQKKIQKQFNEARKYIIGDGMFKKNCEKCKTEPHEYHLSEKEKELDKKGREMLEKMITYKN